MILVHSSISVLSFSGKRLPPGQLGVLTFCSFKSIAGPQPCTSTFPRWRREILCGVFRRLPQCLRGHNRAQHLWVKISWGFGRGSLKILVSHGPSKQPSFPKSCSQILNFFFGLFHAVTTLRFDLCHFIALGCAFVAAPSKFPSDCPKIPLEISKNMCQF